jgi:Flp pilus assembly protein TadG
MLFAICLLPIMAAAGAAVDYSRMAGLHSKLVQAADAAALAALRATPSEKPEKLGIQAFNANLTGNGVETGTEGASVKIQKLTVKVTGNSTRSDVTCRASVRMSFTAVLGYGWRDVDCNATAVQGGVQITELTVLLDNSASMTQPLDPSVPPPIDPNTGCAFSCHVSASYIRSQGVMTKMDEGMNALRQLTAKIGAGTNIKYQVFTVSEKLVQDLPFTADKDKFYAALDNLNFDSSTHLGDEMKNLALRFDTNVNKNTLSALIIVTDGLEEHRNTDYMPPSALTADPFGDPVWYGTFDGIGKPVLGLAMPAGGPGPLGFAVACSDIKAKGTIIYVIYMPHDTTNIPPGESEPHQLNEPASRAALSSCASPGKMFIANSPGDIPGVVAELQKNFSSPLRIAE